MEESIEPPTGHCHLNQNDLGGGGGLVLGLERVEQIFEVGYVFAGKDQDFGGESVFEAVETDGVFAFGRFGAGAFLCVFSVGCGLGSG